MTRNSFRVESECDRDVVIGKFVMQIAELVDSQTEAISVHSLVKTL